MNCWQAVSVCPDLRHGKRSRFPRCLSPLFIYHPLVLSWPVNCWPVSASLASLAWPMPVYWPVDSARIVTAGKNAFPHCCVWVRSSLDKVFPATELRPFFSNTFSMPLYQLLVLVFCKQFCARSREMDIWKHKTVLADPKLSETIQRGILHLEHLQRQYQGVRQIFRSEIVNCNSLQIDWITRWQLHLQAKGTNWEKTKARFQYKISWSLKCFRLLACKLWRCSKF